jgi:hypothetical protein
MKDGKQILCPSAPSNEATILLGIVLANGTVAYADELLMIDDDFVRTAREGTSAEARFRFAGSCFRSGCKQWSSGRCSVIDTVLNAPRLGHLPERLPACSIRGACRWFIQNGSDACRICPFVITDSFGKTDPHESLSEAF